MADTPIITVEAKVQTERLASGRPAERDHIPVLDGLRGLAVLAVIFHHFTVINPADVSRVERAILQFMVTGWFGVNLFFVLSGFLITGILCDSRSGPHYFRNFYMRRTLRIFPLYFGVLAVAFLLLWPLDYLGSAPLRDVAGHQLWLWFYASNFALGWKGLWLYNFNHFWSLAVEEHFYLVWPLAVFWCTPRSLPWVAIGMIIFGLAFRILLYCNGVNDIFTLSMLTPCCIDSLAFGCLAALINRNSGDSRRLARLAGIISAAALLSLVGLFLYRHSAPPGDRSIELGGASLLGFFFASLILALVRSPTSRLTKILSVSWLRTVGKYSYGMYVFHYLLIQPVLDEWLPVATLGRFCHSLFAGQMAYIALGIVGSFAIAFASWHLYEKRFLELKKYFAYAVKPA